MTASRPIAIAEDVRREEERRQAAAWADRSTADLFAQWARDTDPRDTAVLARFKREAARYRARAEGRQD